MLRRRWLLILSGLLLVAAAAPIASADELPPGWGGGEDPPPASAPPPVPTQPPGWSEEDLPPAEAPDPPPAEAPTESSLPGEPAAEAADDVAWPVTEPPAARAAAGAHLQFLALQGLSGFGGEEDEPEPELTAAEETIRDALLPSCADPWTTGFTLLAFPQPDPETTFHNDFGFPRSDDRRHQGIDIFADKGAPVVAIADGVVRRVAVGARAGYYVVVDHADGWQSKYIHLNNDTPGTDDGAVALVDAIAEGIEPGAEVSTGQLLGWVGDSGNAEGTPPHTHFELWHAGHLANPYACLELAWDRYQRVLTHEDTIF